MKRSSACVCLPVLNCVLHDKDEHKKLSELLARFNDRIMKTEITWKTGGAFCSVTRGITERVLNDVVQPVVILASDVMKFRLPVTVS